MAVQAGAGWPKALGVVLNTVVCPPNNSSPGSETSLSETGSGLAVLHAMKRNRPDNAKMIKMKAFMDRCNFWLTSGKGQW